MSKIMIVAGEASGDLHGGRLVTALKRSDPDIDIFGVGGSHMQAAGMCLLYHADQLAYIGFVEVARHYFFFRRVFNHLLGEIKTRKPDVLVLIDYPGFNLRLAKAAKALGVKTFYYIAPQVWAWRENRAAKMARFIDEMAVIFDFEVPFFSRHGIDAHFVGHPLLEGMRPKFSRQEFFFKYGLDENRPVIALLPGSRRQEVQGLLPVMLEAANRIADKERGVQIAVSRAAGIPRSFIEPMTAAHAQVKIIDDATYDLLGVATAALVASGTATLETACFLVPFALVYKVAPLSFAIGKRLVKIPNIGLVNVVAGEKIINEYLQDEANTENLQIELQKLLHDSQLRRTLQQNLSAVKSKLGEPGASEKTARLILNI